jgi:hypothetical protein
MQTWLKMMRHAKRIGGFMLLLLNRDDGLSDMQKVEKHIAQEGGLPISEFVFSIGSGLGQDGAALQAQATKWAAALAAAELL